MAVRDPVEIYGRTTDGWTTGSGYPLAPRLVLTAAHVVAPNGPPLTDVQVRDAEGKLRTADVPWHDADLDVALVNITDPEWLEPSWAQPVRWGRLVTQHAGLRADVRGFPAVTATPEMRDRLDATGRILPGSRTKAGHLAVDIDNPPAPPGDGGSRWAGMSGAAVIEGSFVVGVVVQDPRGFDSRQLVAVPITRFLADPGFSAVVRRHGVRGLAPEPVELDALAERVRAPRTPAGLLRADTARTPFRPRPEFDELAAWCRSDEQFSIRLVHGPGGQGKTRLARHLIGQLAGDGWAGVMLGNHATREQIGVLADGRTPTLVAVDYAEGRATQLEAVIDALERADTPTRLLLLARTAGAWRTERVGPSPLLDDLADESIVLPLEPLEPSRGGRIEAWREALAAFAQGLSDLEEGDWPARAANLNTPALDGDRYRTILAIQIDALAQLLETGDPIAEMGQPPEQLLRLHESRYAKQLATQFGITLDPSRLDALVVSATLWTAPTQDDAYRLLAVLMPGATENDQRVRVAEWLHTIYADGDLYWVGLQPDRLAEHLIGTSLPSSRLPGYFARKVSAEQLEHGITVLGRAAPRYPELWEFFEQTLRSAGTTGGLTAMRVAVQLETPTDLLKAIKGFVANADDDALRALESAAPRSSAVLGTTNALIAERLAEHVRERARHDREAYLPELAEAVNKLAVRLAEAGRHAESLAAAQEAVQLYRELVASDRGAYLPDLAMSVHNLAGRLGEVGRRTEGLAAAEEAVGLYQELVSLNRDTYLPHLALSINNLGAQLAKEGHRAQAMAAAQKSLSLYRELTDRDHDTYLPGLAASINNFATLLSKAGRRAESLAAAQEAASIFRELAHREQDLLNRDAYLSDFAASISNLAISLGEAGLRAEGLAAAQEAVDLRRELVTLNRDAYLPDLAESINNLAIDLAEAGRSAEGLSFAQEAVDLRRELVTLNRDAYLPDLAQSINNLAQRLADEGRRRQALAAAQEAVDLRRELVTLNRDAYLPDLAQSIDNLAQRLAEEGRRTEGVAAAQEAVDLYSESAHLDREAHLGDLAQAINNLAVHLVGVGRRADALLAGKKAVILRRELTKADPSRYADGLAQSEALVAYLTTGGPT